MPMVDETTADIGSLITRRPLGNTFFKIIAPSSQSHPSQLNHPWLIIRG
jgi:hypothetical protein